MKHEHDTEHEHKLNLEENSPYRVAYDLMKDIASAEKRVLTAENGREYYLTLFDNCRRAVLEGSSVGVTAGSAHNEEHSHAHAGHED